MPYWRDEGRPVIWTREGKLVYNDREERDPLLGQLFVLLRELIRRTPTDPRALYEVSKSINKRQKELET